jgi:hypothetical protein
MGTCITGETERKVLAGAKGSVGLVFMQSSRHGFKTIGFTDRTNDEILPILQSYEFAVVICTGDGEQEITDMDCKCVDIHHEKGGCDIVVEYVNSDYDLKLRVAYALVGDLLYKHVSIGNQSRPVRVLKIWVEDIMLDAAIERGGGGQPAFIDSTLFIGLEHPAGITSIGNKRLRIGHCPGRILRTGETLTSLPLVIGGGQKNRVADSFMNYLRDLSPRKIEHLKVYCDWGLHDELSPGPVQLTEALTIGALDVLADLKTKGVLFDYYLMDAFWFDPTGDYTQFKKPNWPNGFGRAFQTIKKLGLKLGLWYHVSGGVDRNPELEQFKAKDGHLCLACHGYQQVLIQSIRHFIQEYDLALLKFDFAVFDCDNPRHDHLLDDYAREATINGLLHVIQEARSANPSILIFAYNTFMYQPNWMAPVVPGREGYPISPWWGKFCDMIYCGDPRPSEIPALSLRDSINCYTDHQYQIFKESLLPLEVIDDHGVMVGSTGTVYWEGKNKWRDIWTIMVSRGALKSHFYGDLALLDQEDADFMRDMLSLVDANVDTFNASISVLGQPGKGEVYGYSCVGVQSAFLTIVNPTFFKQTISWIENVNTLDLIYSSSNNLEVYQHCDRTKIHLEPFTVVMVKRPPSEPRDLTSEQVQESAVVREILRTTGEHGTVCANTRALAFSNTGITLRFCRNGIPWRGILQPSQIRASAFTLDGTPIELNHTPNVRVWSGCSWILLYAEIGEKILQFEVELDIPNDVQISVFEVGWGKVMY